MTDVRTDISSQATVDSSRRRATILMARRLFLGYGRDGDLGLLSPRTRTREVY